VEVEVVDQVQLEEMVMNLLQDQEEQEQQIVFQDHQLLTQVEEVVELGQVVLEELLVREELEVEVPVDLIVLQQVEQQVQSILEEEVEEVEILIHREVDQEDQVLLLLEHQEVLHFQ
jgi:hypothetical protein